MTGIGIEPAVMIRQAAALAGDFHVLAQPLDRQIRALLAEWAAVRKVYLIGSGDSYHAACAAEMAFAELAAVRCEAMSAYRFLDYGPPPWWQDVATQRTLVIAASASGGTPRVVQAVERAKEKGMLTLGLTGKPGSDITRAADRSLVVELADQERSPGIRTYQASLLGMLTIAIHMAETENEGSAAAAAGLRRELAAMADAVAATSRAIQEESRRVAEAIADAPAMIMLGSGPNLGTARFAAAKMVEAAGVMAVGQDLEEWRHVERLARPADMPTFVIAPPGRSHRLAAALAAEARQLGRRVIAVTHHADTEVARQAWAVLPVAGETREELSPLLYHVFSAQVACHVAEKLGRRPFEGGRQASSRGGELPLAPQSGIQPGDGGGQIDPAPRGRDADEPA